MHQILKFLMLLSVTGTFAFGVAGFGKFDIEFYVTMLVIGIIASLAFMVIGGRSLGKHQLKLYAQKQHIQSGGENKTAANERSKNK